MLAKSITELIGNTPLLELDPGVHNLKNIRLFAKMELFNPLGSLKDRAAFAMISEEIAQVAAKSQTVIESSSGNTAIALASICAMHGVPLQVVTNRIRIQEPKSLLRFLGATVLETAGVSSCPDPTDPDNPLAQIERIMAANSGDYFHPSQYTNVKNSGSHFDTTGPEIIADLAGETVHYFVTGLGTAGSSRGVGEYLLSLNPETQIVGVVARKGHLIPGIRNADEMYEVGLFNRALFSEIQEIDTSGAIDGITILSRQLGILAGPSSGASYIAALRHLRTVDNQLTERRNAVIIICDRIEKYLSFVQKHRPELFGLNVRKPSPLQLSEQEVKLALELSVEDAKQWMNDNFSQATIVVDTRGPIAYRAGHIPGSLNFPADKLDETCEFGIPFSSGTRIIFVCPSGDESRLFASFLSQRGIVSASLRGGFVAWRDSQSPVEKNQVK